MYRTILVMFVGVAAVADDAPIRALTHGPQGHWFGYYDKLQFDEADRYVLCNEVGFQDRSPTPEDRIGVGMVDTGDGDKWIPLGETRAWSWQQGCMLQWVPGTKDTVIYNDRRDDRFISIVQNVFTGEKRELPKAVYALSSDGKRAAGLDFARVDDTRPGYGYKGGADLTGGALVPESGGIYVMDLATGEARDIVTYAQIAAIPQEEATEGRHWFNHLLFNTDGSRMIFLHRAFRKAPKEGSWVTRMFTVAPDGSALHCVNDHGMVSHFIWKNPTQILAWSREPADGNHFHLYTDQSDTCEVVGDGVLKQDGHCTYSPDREWVLTDTYPDKERKQHLMLYRPRDGKLVELGAFFLDRVHTGEWRCDLHARWSRSGEYVCLD